MIPLCLVTGFLGSGKTTFLQRLVKKYSRRRLVYLVNEFSSVDVDGQLLNLPADRLVSVPGGSIFCRCLVQEFISQLKKVAGLKPTGVVVEASGVADPRSVQTMLKDTKLDQVYELSSVITLATADTLLKLLKTLPAIQAQLEAADWIILNKSDLADKKIQREARREIARIRPEARIIETSYAEADLDIFAEQERDELLGEYTQCRDPHFARVELHPPGPVRLVNLQQAVVELAPYRAKGFVALAQGMTHVDFADGRWVSSPCGEAEENGLLLIFDPHRQRAAERLKRKVESGGFAA